MHGPNRSLRSRIPLPSSVVTVAVEATERSSLVEILGAARVLPASDLRDAEKQLASEPDSCLILGVPGDSDPGAIAYLVAFRERFPVTPVLAVFYSSRSSTRAALRLGAIGITEILDAPAGTRIDPMRDALCRCRGADIAVRLWQSCDLKPPESAVPLLKAALRLAIAPITSQSLAAAVGLHERSLRKYCSREGLPSPQFIIGWARLLLAAFYLSEPGRTINQTAEMLGFPDASSLRNQLKRYTNRTCGSLRVDGIVACVARALEGAMAVRCPSAHVEQIAHATMAREEDPKPSAKA